MKNQDYIQLDQETMNIREIIAFIIIIFLVNQFQLIIIEIQVLLLVKEIIILLNL